MSPNKIFILIGFVFLFVMSCTHQRMSSSPTNVNPHGGVGTETADSIAEQGLVAGRPYTQLAHFSISPDSTWLIAGPSTAVLSRDTLRWTPVAADTAAQNITVVGIVKTTGAADTI